ncbi:carbamoyltransferase N-terminal domain-containing protein [Dactylosporangium matsuzakiense]|uniref:Nodulation protein U n=1 Tax=Dactylosporangium matsuzakiense TaxID=53360 RepID=A0A9W6NJM5_9ACTN|nr:carbamoyltransferase N-terminal domain-containing protein [Dactylosporangium matsuzakiense]GLK99172.1 nodulation protein U [Dactylosporangium matsuzakiense]
MLICGIKASHDGGVAVIDGNRLVFSIEAEKIGNAFRYSPLTGLEQVTQLLTGQGVDPADVDQFVVDGYWTDDAAVVRTRRSGAPFTLPVAPYLDAPDGDPLRRYTFGDHDFAGPATGYASYHHTANHLIGAYCSSPFAARGEDGLVLIWDGGMTLRLYQVDRRLSTVRMLGTLLPMIGSAFSDFCAAFDPFRYTPQAPDPEAVVRHSLSIAGKAMAYAALGSVHEDAFGVIDGLLAERFAAALGLRRGQQTPSFQRLAGKMAALSMRIPDSAREVGEQVAAERDTLLPGLSNADLIATFQEYLGRLLLHRLTEVVRRHYPNGHPPLAMAGGCALNIKWNRAIRDSGLFSEVWVPPFPNDSGAAIGTASCEMVSRGGHWALDWNVYSGPDLVGGGAVPAGWSARPCDEREVAAILHQEGDPIVVLSGRAEIGPRALGNRSILAPAVDPLMKDRLNEAKDRAYYRPVAPICLASRASEVFDPGGDDRYMLFEHRLRNGWDKRIPAIVHLDGTARLQTIEPTDSSTGRILEAYEQLSGVPVLCNTSANLNGRGFFPDVRTAAEWGRTRHIWSDGTLYTNLQWDRDAS